MGGTRSRRGRDRAVRRIDALFDFERGINGLAAEQRLCVRKEQGAASDGSRLLRSASVAEPINSMLKRWDRFARGRLSNNTAERALRGFALDVNHGRSPASIAVPTAPRSWQR